MLRNYLLTAWKVFLRRKFFTFINLFGISLTLTVIIVSVRIAENHLYPKGPEKDNQHYVVISHLTLTNDKQSNRQSSYPGFKFMNDYVYSLKTPEIISAFTKVNKISNYDQGIKIEYSLRRTDANYWQILQFDFSHGLAYSQEQFEYGRFVAVINQKTALQYFDKINVVGEFINVANQRFEIIGVVKNVPRTEVYSYADIWVPYTTFPTTSYRSKIMGRFAALLYHSNSDKLNDISLEFIHKIKNQFVTVDEADIRLNKAFSHADDTLQALARDIFGDKLSFEDYVQTLIAAASLLSFLFMLLPSINMVNLSVSRTMERASEIGVRKAFGASTLQLVGQFMIENVLLTLIGGVLALFFSTFILASIEMSGIVPYVEFDFNLKVFFASLFMILVFSLISGVYPAFKMARLNPVLALKGGM